MSNVIELPNRDLIEEQACAWIAKLDRGALSSEENKELIQWLHERHEHQTALYEMAKLLDQLSLLSSLSELFPLNSRAICRDRAEISQSWPLLKPLVASVAVVCLLVAGWRFYGGDRPDFQSGVVATMAGEQKEIGLADGSEVILNTSSRIDVDYDELRRRVVLLDGEATFHVAHDEARPFYVVVDSTTVKAVGTAFNIERRREGIEITVTEGKVEVSSDVKLRSESPGGGRNVGVNGDQATRLSAGEMLLVSNGREIVSPINSIGVEKKLAWQKGMVVFEGETLEQVVDEVTRYTTRKFVFADDSIRAIRIGGYFETHDVDALLDILEHGFNIGVSIDANGVIYLSRSENS